MSRYGYIPDPTGHVVTRFDARYRSALSADLPGTLDLSRLCPEITDQEQTGSCVGHAIAAGVAVVMGEQIASPRSVYCLARCVDRLDAYEPLTDTGAAPNQAMRALAEWGAWRELWTPAGVDCEPLLVEVEAAAQCRLRGATRIVGWPHQSVRAALAGGYPVAVATYASGAWQTTGGRGVLPAESDDPDHYVLVVGCRPAAIEGTHEYLVRNSWGTSWGTDGYAWCSYHWLDNTRDRYALTLERISWAI